MRYDGSENSQHAVAGQLSPADSYLMDMVLQLAFCHGGV